MSLGGLVITLAGLARGEQLHPGRFSLDSALAFAYLVLIGSIVAFSAFHWLLRNAPTSIVSTYAYVNPVVAVLLGAAFLSEPLTLRTLVAGAAIVVSVVLIVGEGMRAPRLRRLVPARGTA
jgi:drug/metabolite transporter (DMT)-like permease